MMQMNSDRERFDIKLAYEHLTGYEVKIPTFATKRAAKVLCPVHSENHPSCELDLDKQKWFCFVCRIGGDAVAMVVQSGKCGSGASRDVYRAAFEWLRSITGQQPVHLLAQPHALSFSTRNVARPDRRLVFPFLDRQGQLAYEEIRDEGFNEQGKRDKDIMLRRPLPPGLWHADGNYFVYRDLQGHPVPYGPNDSEPIRRERYTKAGVQRRKPPRDHLYSLRGVERLLYRTPEVLALARTHGRLHMVGGAKKNDALRDRTGWTVTTTAKGETSDLEATWLDDVAGIQEMVIWSDSDPVGRRAAIARARFFRPRIFRIRIVDLYFDDSKRDIYDFLIEHRNLSREQLVSELEARIARASLFE